MDVDRLLARLTFGSAFWNIRRAEDPETPIVLEGANLRQADFRGARLANASYAQADLEGALNLPVEVKP